jgi:hypothetical protein
MFSPARTRPSLGLIVIACGLLCGCTPLTNASEATQQPVQSTTSSVTPQTSAELPQLLSLAVAGSPGASAMGPSTANVRYVSGNGSNANDGLSPATGKEDVYTALVDLTNSTPGSSGGVVNLSQNSADAGTVKAQPIGLLASRTTGGIWIMGPGDPNFVRIASVSRTNNVVTLVARAAIPSSAYYQAGRTISIFALSDPSFDGNFIIASISGSTLTYSQTGADASIPGGNGVLTPIGWIPQNSRGYDFRGQGGASGLATGGAGAVTGMVAGQQYSGPPVPITAAIQAGSTVTATVGVSTKTWVGLPVKIAGIAPAGYNGTFIVTSAPTNTTFTYEAPASGLPPSSAGLAMIELPSIWLSGVSDISFRDVSVGGPLPLLIGVDSNMGLISSPPMANLHFMNVNFSVQFNSSPLPGPATWIGSNALWIYFDNCLWEANKTALVTSDERAAVLLKSTGGQTSGLVYISKSNSSGGGGVRWYKQQGSSIVNIDGFVEEGAGQSQPVFEVMSSSGSLSATIQNVLIADSGDKPPAVRVPIGWPAGSSSVTVINARSGGIATQGPMTVINTVISNLQSVAGTTVPVSSPQAQGQSGFSGGNSYNLQTNAARSNFSAAAVRFQNLASQSPSQWTVAEGKGVAIKRVAAPDGTQNAGLATCTDKGPSGICGIYVYNSSQTFSAGDYVVAEVWVRAADHSAGPYTGFEGTLNLSGPTLSNTYYGTNVSSSNRANASPMDDGAWQRIYIWVKVAGGGKVTARMRLDFTPQQPTMFYAPAIYFFPGKQIAPPPAPAVTQTAAGSLAATTYYVRTSYVSGTGETLSSAETSMAASTGIVLGVASPPAVPGATGWNLYLGNTASCPGVDAGASTGAGETCEVKQNAVPLPIGADWAETVTGRVPFNGWYTGSMGPAGQTPPTNDSTNAFGDSEIADFALNTQSLPADITGGPTVATMQGLNFAFGGSGDNYHAILDHTNLTANQTYIFPNQSGQIALSNVAQTFTAPQTFDSVSMNKATIAGETISAAPEAVFNAFLPGALDSAYTAATFLPEHGVLVDRVVVTLKTMPQGCGSNAVVRVNGTKTWDSVIASSLTDSGPVNLPMDLGASIQVIVQTPAQGCVVAPQDANVAIHYRMQ